MEIHNWEKELIHPPLPEYKVHSQLFHQVKMRVNTQRKLKKRVPYIWTIGLCSVATSVLLLLGITNPFSPGSRITTASNSMTSNQVTSHVTVVSQRNLENWKISLTPRLGVGAQYLGKNAIDEIKLKTTAGYEIKTGHATQNQEVFRLQDVSNNNNTMNGQYTLTLTWYEQGQLRSGTLTYRITD